MASYNQKDIQTLASNFETASSSLHILQSVHQFNSKSHDFEEDSVDDTAEIHAKDPAIVVSDLSAQTSFLRKLKFQYLEQNAKDKYVKTIVSDIDDAPIVTADDNKALLALNEQMKERLKAAKEKLALKQKNIRELAPTVEQDYNKAQYLTSRMSSLSQRIIDTRLALTRLRQSHPHPRLTIPLADQKLADQVVTMQTLNDEIEGGQREMQKVREKVKEGASEVERLKVERAEAELAVRKIRERAKEDKEDERLLVPLYDWYTSSLALHRSIHDLVAAESVSENELRLTYRIDTSTSTSTFITPTLIDIIISLIFEPTSRKLATVRVTCNPENASNEGVLGLPENAMDEIIGVNVQKDDPHGVVGAILARVRGGQMV